MFLFWISAALLTVAAVLTLARPLTRRPTGDEDVPRPAADVAVYKDQIAEIEADKARGLISVSEAEAARIEIARRLLAAAEDQPERAAQTTETPPRLTTDRLFTVMAATIPAIALALYMALGSPGLPGVPVAERLARAPAANADVEELVARVEAQLRKNPADGQGWDVIAPVYLRIERFGDAAEAFRRALDLLGETPRRLSGLAESTVLANDGIVTEMARKAYQRLNELEPGRTDARFGLAMALEQDGELDAAEAAYRELADNAPPNVPWRVFILQRLEAIAEKRGTAGANRGQNEGQAPTPDPAAAEAIAGLPEQQRREVILRMVEGLAARLEANGRDADGWQRLLRAWTVLGEQQKAETALIAARKALAGDDKGLSEINALAKSLGLKS